MINCYDIYGGVRNETRKNFSSRLGFILVSSRMCDWNRERMKFPYMCGAYGGAAFILIYLIFRLLWAFQPWSVSSPSDVEVNEV